MISVRKCRYAGIA